jgi:hypothetical protein
VRLTILPGFIDSDGASTRHPSGTNQRVSGIDKSLIADMIRLPAQASESAAKTFT